MSATEYQGIKECFALEGGGARWRVLRAVRRRAAVQYGVWWEGSISGAAGGLPAELQEVVARVAAGRAVTVAALPIGTTLTRRLRVPFEGAGKVRRVLPSLLDVQVPFPIEECVYVFTDEMKVAGGGMEVLAVLARKQDVERHLADLRGRLGIDPVLLDHEGLALWAQSITEIPPEGEEIRVVVWLGERAASVVVGCGRKYVTARCWQVTLDETFTEGEEESGARVELMRRVRRLIMAHADELGTGRVRWLWCGPEAVGRSLPQGTESGAVFDGPVVFETHDDPAWILARGLAGRMLRPQDYGKACDLRGEAWPHPLALRRRRGRRMRTAAAYLVAGALMCGMNVAWRAGVHGKEMQLADAIGDCARRITGMGSVPYGQEVLVAGRAMEKRRRRLDPFLMLQERPVERLLAELTAEAERSGAELVSLHVSRREVDMEGSCARSEEARRLARKLEKAGYETVFHTVAGRGGRISFTIKGIRSK